MRHHVQFKIVNALSLSDGELEAMFDCDPQKLREQLIENQKQGHIYIPTAGCDEFDVVTGCPGHEDKPDVRDITRDLTGKVTKRSIKDLTDEERSYIAKFSYYGAHLSNLKQVDELFSTYLDRSNTILTGLNWWKIKDYLDSRGIETSSEHFQPIIDTLVAEKDEYRFNFEHMVLCNEKYKADIEALNHALKQIEQMSDCGNGDLAVIRMKDIATAILSNHIPDTTEMVEASEVEDFYHGVHIYKGDEFQDFVGRRIHVWDDHSTPYAQCYKIQFLGSTEVIGNMDDSDINFQEDNILTHTENVEQAAARTSNEMGIILGAAYHHEKGFKMGAQWQSHQSSAKEQELRDALEKITKVSLGHPDADIRRIIEIANQALSPDKKQ